MGPPPPAAAAPPRPALIRNPHAADHLRLVDIQRGDPLVATVKLPAPGKRTASSDHGAPASAGNHPRFSARNGRPARDIKVKREDL
jgi:hypothetical protein